MNWLRKLLGRDRQRERSVSEAKLDHLEAVSEARIKRIDRVAAEQRQLAATLKNVTKAMRADAKR